MNEVNTVPGSRQADSYIVVNNTVILFLRFLALWALGWVMVLFLPRYLGDQGLGQLQFALSFVSLFTIALALGVRHYLIKEVARNHAQIHAYLGSALGLKLLTTAVVVPAIVVIASQTDYSAEAKWAIYAAAIWMVVTSFAHLLGGVLNGLEDMTWPSLSETANKLAVVAIGVPVLVTGHGVLVYIGVLVAGAVVQLVINAWYLGRRYPLKIDFKPHAVKALVIGGAPFLLMGFVLGVYQHVDVVMLRIISSEAVVGWYAAAMQIFRSVEFLSLVLTTALLPTLSRLHVNAAPVLAAMAKRSIVVIGLFTVPLALAICLLSREIFTLLPYPDVFQSSAPLLSVLALSIPITAFLTILGTIAVAVDRQQRWALAMVGTLALNVGLNALAIPYFQQAYNNGAIGASLATLASESAMVLVGVWLMPKGVLDKGTGITFLKIGLCSGIALLVVLLLHQFGLPKPALLVIGGVIYAGLALATRAVLWGELRFLWQAVSHRVKAGKQQVVREGEESP
jgi:O-antigen/teichoic acid export membrane protein